MSDYAQLADVPEIFMSKIRKKRNNAQENILMLATDLLMPAEVRVAAIKSILSEKDIVEPWLGEKEIEGLNNH
jgi:hypothetical protein